MNLAGALLLLALTGRLAAQNATPPAAEPVPQARESAPAAPEQAADQAPGQVSDPVLKPNPLAALRDFEPAADEAYRLGKGDEITVDFAGRPEMQAKLVVGPDGRITLPLAGDLTLSGLTRPEAAKAIDSALAAYYSNLSAQVTVTKYTANHVLLLGAVEHPGMIAFDGTPTLIEALTRGGMTMDKDRNVAVPEQCAIYRGQNQVVWVQLKKMLESGNALADLRLRRDDVIYVPDLSTRFVSVLGEVSRPGAVTLTSATTLVSVIAAAGGPTEKAGGNPRIQIIDPASGNFRNFFFNDLINPAKSTEATLKPGEIIYVPKSGFYRASYVLERLSPLVSLASMGLWAVVQ
jgi:polysaccharide export outer membrane protein